MLLDEIAAEYDPSDPSSSFDFWLKRLEVQCMRPWLRGDVVLELGCATGESTALLQPFCRRLHVLEGSQINIVAARQRVPNATFTHTLWEDFDGTDQYTDIICMNVLEHVEDPVRLLRSARSWLAPAGRIHITVPNGNSLHRHLGVELGLAADVLALTDNDIAQGHRRNYIFRTLVEDITTAGYRVLELKPVFLKLLPNAEMLDWDWDRIEAVHRLARFLPIHSAEIYVCVEAR